MFSDLGEAKNTHWVVSAPSTRDSPEDSNKETRRSALSPVSPRAFDPAVSRPDPRVSATASPDLLRASAVTVSHMPRTNLSQEDIWHCKVCDVQLSGIEPARQHYAGKQHKKALQRAQMQDEMKQGVAKEVPLTCVVCVKSFTGEISAKQHYDSSAHLRAVEGAAKWARTQADQAATPPTKEELPSSSKEESRLLDFSTSFSLFSEGGIGMSQGKGHLLEDLTKVVDPGKKSSSPRAAIAVSPADSTGVGTLSDDASRFAGASSSGAGAISKVPSETTAGRTSSSALPKGPPMGGMSPEDRDVLKRKVIALCTTTLEGIMKQVIPYVANQIADVVLEGLCSNSTTNPRQDGTGKAPNAVISAGVQDGSNRGPSGVYQGSSSARQKEEKPFRSSDQSYTDMPPLVDTGDDASLVPSHGSVGSNLMGESGPVAQNDLSKVTETNDAYSELWNSLTQKKGGSL